jgi:histidine triad (HIT) family protein
MMSRMSDTIFARIIRNEVPAKVVYEDELALAFEDVQPVAPVHILVIPKTTELDELSSATPEHQALLGHLLLVANRVAQQAGLTDFRVVINSGQGAGQSVFHLHLHILGGRPMHWPPG